MGSSKVTALAWMSSAGRLALVTLVGAVALLAGLAGPLQAQTVHGRLLEQETMRPIASGLVTLLDEDSDEVDRAETDSLGHFTLEFPEPGTFYVRAERIGYRTRTDGVLEIEEGGEITIDFYLGPDPVEIEGVEATGERTDWLAVNERRYLEGQGFFERRKLGFGHFITSEEIEEEMMFSAWDLFRKIPGIRVSVPPRPSVGGMCAVYLDGTLVHQEQDGRWTMADYVAVEEISGVEVYTRMSSVPIQYSLGGCGSVILVWTKG